MAGLPPLFAGFATNVVLRMLTLDFTDDLGDLTATTKTAASRQRRWPNEPTCR
jgi:hypothetical protein